MEDRLFKNPNFRDTPKKSDYLDPLKEFVPAYVLQLLERALKYWEQGDLPKAKESITEFNAHLPGFHIGVLIELAINLRALEPHEILDYLNGIPDSKVHGL